MIFTGMSLDVLALFFGSSLIIFVISVFLNSRKVNISSLLKCFLTFYVEWFLKCLNKCFRDFFFREDNFFNLRVFVKFVKYSFKASDIFSLSLIILSFLWRKIVCSPAKAIHFPRTVKSTTDPAVFSGSKNNREAF